MSAAPVFFSVFFFFFFFSLISLAVLFAVGVEFVAEIEVGV